MQIKIRKPKHKIPSEAIGGISYDEAVMYENKYPFEYKEEVKLPCFIEEPSPYIPTHVEPFVVNELKEKFHRKGLDVIPTGENGFYSLNEGGLYVSLSVYSWLHRLEKIGTKEVNPFFGSRKILDCYRSIPSTCEIIGSVGFEKFDEINPKFILNVLTELGFDSQVISTPRQVEKMLEKLTKSNPGSQFSIQSKQSKIDMDIFDDS